MYDVLSVAMMKRCDAATIESKTSSTDLMRKAAMGVFEAVGDWSGHTAIVVGSGNNGGDGYALATILYSRGFKCSIHTLAKPKTPSAIHFSKAAAGCGSPIIPFVEDGPLLENANTIVDCIFGVGFHGEAQGDYAEAIEYINFSDAYVVSVDINSGLNGDSGEAITAVKSDLTVSVGYLKTGMLIQRASSLIGELVNVDIGIDLLEPEHRMLDAKEFKAMLKKLDQEPIEARESKLLLGEIDPEQRKTLDEPDFGIDHHSPIEVANNLSKMLASPILVKGRSCDFLVDGKTATFLKPDWFKG